MEKELPYSINLTLLKTEARQMMEMCFWKSSHHWSSYPARRKRNEPRIIIRVAYFKILNWFGFNFCKYHREAVEVIQQLPCHERFFLEKVQSRYTKFKVWCIDGKHFERVLEQLKEIEHIELEFVVHPSSQGLVIPKPFAGMGLTFYERGALC